jgi:ribosomal protein S17
MCITVFICFNTNFILNIYTIYNNKNNFNTKVCVSEERSKYIKKYRKYHTQTSRQSAWLKHRAEASIMRAIDEVYTSNPWCHIPAKSPRYSKRRSKRSKCPAHRGINKLQTPPPRIAPGLGGGGLH